MDKPTARIIAVADKGGVAGARGAGHHLTEEATKEQGVRQPCSYRSVCDISVLILLCISPGKKSNLIAPIHFVHFQEYLINLLFLT